MLIDNCFRFRDQLLENWTDPQIAPKIVLQGTMQESVTQVKLGQTLNYRLFGVFEKNIGRSWKLVKKLSIKQLSKNQIPKDN